MESKAILMGIAIAVLVFLSGCASQATRLPQPNTFPEQSIANGRRLIASYGCGSCHSIPGVPGADATVGPSLDRFYQRSYIAGRLPNNLTNLVEWIQDPQQIKPSTAMPNLGVTANQAIDMAAYLYHQQTLGDLIGR